MYSIRSTRQALTSVSQNEAGISSTDVYPLSFRKSSTPEFTGGNSVRAPRLASKSILPARSTIRLNWLKSSWFFKKSLIISPVKV